MLKLDGLKKLKTRLTHLASTACVAVLLSGCLGNDYQTHTRVYDDGSIERTIKTISADSVIMQKNMFGATRQNAWQADMQLIPPQGKDTTSSGIRYAITWSKWFPTADAANRDAETSQAPFRIQSSYATEFWWFYTDVTYIDTYKSTIRFDKVSPDDYFTSEDYAYMERVRAASVLSHEDSITSSVIEAKKEQYFARGLFEEIYAVLSAIISKRYTEPTVKATLETRKEWLFQSLATRDFDPAFLEQLLTDSMSIRMVFTPEEKQQFEILDERHFFTLFDSFDHTIEMPSGIVDSNADSTSGNQAFWHTQGTLIKDLSMKATARTINYWAIIATIFIVTSLGFIILARRSVLISRE